MSQQYPGQPAGGGGMPPGYGGAPPGPGGNVPPGQIGGPPGPGGAMPPGYGGAVPPGSSGYGGAPGASAPAGMPGQQPSGLVQPPKSNRVLLIAGIGCGLFLLLGVAVVVAAVFWLKARGNAAVEELQRLQASASAMAGAGAAPVGSPGQANPTGELTGDCLTAYRCCQAIAAKSPAGSAATQACEVFKTPAYPTTICAGALTGYRKVAEQTGVRCE